MESASFYCASTWQSCEASVKDVFTFFTRGTFLRFINFFYFYNVFYFILLTLQRAEMRMIRWMCGIKITDTFSNSELRERLGRDDIITVIQ